MGADVQSWWRRLLARLFGEQARTTLDRGPFYAKSDPTASIEYEPSPSITVDSKVELPAATPAEYTYALRDDFLSRAEQSFFHVLRDAVAAEYLIFPKVGLADLVYPPRQEGQFGAWQRINRKHVDFVLCDPRTLRPRAALELDDRSHRRPDRLERDAFVEKVFADASLPLIRVPAQRTYHRQMIAMMVAEAVTQQEVAMVAVPAVEATAGTVKTCDRCGGEMKVRKAAQGTHRGEQFWGCTNYPKCRNIVKIAGDAALQLPA